MDEKIIIPIFIIIVLIIIAGQYQYHKFNYVSCLMNGFYESPIAFSQKAGLKSLQLYIQNKSIYFLVRDQDGNIVMNKCVRFSKSYNWSDSTSNIMVWDIEFDEEIEPFPQNCQLRFDLEKIMIHLITPEDETIWVECFKNCAATAGIC